ncbi:MAG: ABC transporter permease [Sarcina sp.]
MSSNFSFCGYIVLVLAMLLFIVSMGMNVEQRVKWYAIMRSIGLTKKSMKRLVLLQSIIIGAIGYVLGVITSTIVVEVLKTNFMTMNMSFMLSPAIYIVSAIAVLFITFLTYIIISFKLDRLDIIEAIARE